MKRRSLLQAPAAGLLASAPLSAVGKTPKDRYILELEEPQFIRKAGQYYVEITLTEDPRCGLSLRIEQFDSANHLARRIVTALKDPQTIKNRMAVSVGYGADSQSPRVAGEGFGAGRSGGWGQVMVE